MSRTLLFLLGCLAASPAAASRSPRQGGEVAEESGAETNRESEDRRAFLANSIENRIAAGWTKYDSAASGHLNQEEFSLWMNDLRAENGNGPADEGLMQAAFRVADSDEDGLISRNELTAFMMVRNRVRQ
jgi:Ca2+-binding EF-hand superfamily protein